MSYKDRLRSAQGSEKTYPKIITDINLDVRETDGKAAFSFWDKMEEKIVFTTKPIHGVLIGKCMVASVFDDNLGSKGGTYKTSYYLTRKNKVALFDNMGKIEQRGTIEELESFSNTLTGNLSKKQVIFVLTTNGLIAVTTNLTLAIGQFSSINNALFIDNEIVLTPRIYDPEDLSITKKTKKYLGKFASKNPPKYAFISVGDAIDENMPNLETSIDMFIQWRDFMLSDKQDVSEAHEDKAEEVSADTYDPEPDDNDLPF